MSLAWPGAAFTDAELVDPYHANETLEGGQELRGPFVLRPARSSR